MTMIQFRWAVLGCVGLAGLLLGCVACKKDPPSSVPEPDWKSMTEAWDEHDPIPAYALIDQNGDAFRMSRFDGEHVLIGFVFSRCPMPKACPLTMQRMAEVQRLWKAAESEGKTAGKNLHIVVATIDPDFDTPALLKQYAKGYGADFRYWTMATGPKGLVDSAFPSLFNVFAFPREEGVISHNVNTGLLRPDRTIWKEWANNEFVPKDVVKMVLEGAE